MANATTLFFPVEAGDTPQKWKLVRPTFLQWNDLQTNIRPIAGQKIRIRETAQVSVSKNTQVLSSMLWNNRFQDEAFLGHFQVTRVNGSGFVKLITERGNMIGQALTVGESYVWHFQREYDLDLFLQSTDKNAAYLSAIVNCNADLAPGFVPNNFINSDNVIAYVRGAFGYSIEDSPNIQNLLNALALPVVSGYRFPETTLFRAINNIPGVNLDGYEIATRLGDVELWIHPDWLINEQFEYTYEVIHYNRLEPTLDQFPVNESCTYPTTIPFP